MTPANLITDVAFVVYPVSNMPVARAFYEGALGLTETANWEDQWIEYDIGNGTLAITKADETHRSGLHGPSIALEVTDFDQALTSLQESAIPIATGPWDSPACRGCIIRDPDQNEIILHAKK